MKVSSWKKGISCVCVCIQEKRLHVCVPVRLSVRSITIKGFSLGKGFPAIEE